MANDFIAQDDLLQSNCNTGSRERATVSVLGKPTAVSLALFYLGSSSQFSTHESRPGRPQLLFGRLAALDPPAARGAFRAVESACSSSGSKALIARYRSMCEQILATVDDVDLRSLVLEALVRDYDAATPQAFPPYFSEHLKSPTLKAILQLPLNSGINPAAVDRQLQIWGASVCARRCEEGTWTPALNHEVAEWIRMLRAAGENGNVRIHSYRSTYEQHADSS